MQSKANRKNPAGMNLEDRIEYLETQVAFLECRVKEQRLFSQNGEDGITMAIFDLIGFTNRFYVEFGTESGIQCNSRILWDSHYPTGLLMDLNNENPEIHLFKERITAENIVTLFEKYQVPKQFDFLSVDIDYNDWYVMKKILEAYYRPRLVIVEYNGCHAIFEDKIVLYDADYMWDGTNYYSASLLAFVRLFERFEYSLVYCEKSGVNAFFMPNELIPLIRSSFPFINRLEFLYTPFKNKEKIPKDSLNRPYVESKDLL